MIQSNSKIKERAFSLIQKFDSIAKPKIQNKLIAWFWNSFFLSHAQKAIIATPDQELKQYLKEGYDELKPIFEDVDLAFSVQESKKLNDGKMQKFVESTYKEVLELLPDA